MNLSALGYAAASTAAAAAMLAALAPALQRFAPSGPPPDPPAAVYTDLRERSAAAGLFAECFEGADDGGDIRLAARKLPWPAPAAGDVGGGFVRSNQADYERHNPAGNRCAGLAP